MTITTTTMNKNTDTKTSNAAAPLFTTDYNVYINHTDAGGIVYHANHLVSVSYTHLRAHET